MSKFKLILKIAAFCVAAAMLITIAAIIVPVFLIMILPILGYGTYLLIQHAEDILPKNLSPNRDDKTDE